MNNRYPYEPDMNPPPGIPRNYPYGPTPMPTSNPMYPSYPSDPGFMPNASAYPSATSFYPSTASPYPSTTSPYSSATSSYPPTISPYPANASSYPSANSPYSVSSNNPYSTSFSPSKSGRISPYSNAPISHIASSSAYSGVHPGAYSSVSSGLNYNTSGHSVPRQTSPSRSYRNMAQFMLSEGTVKLYPNFDAKQDAAVLRKAMKGFGTDEKAIINVLAKRTNAQRTHIAVAFKQLYGKDLIDDLKSELRGNFEDVIIALMIPINNYLASELHNAIAGLGTDEDVLVEIICTRTNREIWGINESYRRLYGKSLEHDIRGDTSGHFRRLLVSICTGARSEAPADKEKAVRNAHELFAAGVGQWGTDESVFNSILAAESFHQLAATFHEYEKLAGHTVAEAIDKEMSGDLKKGMLAIVHGVENKPLYFAKKLYKAMKGLGTDDRTLIRIVVSRCEIDMVQIKAEYERNYGKPLADAISADTSGDYRRVLIALIDG